MFPAKVLQDYAMLDDDSFKGEFERFENPWAPVMATQETSMSADIGQPLHKAPLLKAQKIATKYLGKSRIG